MVFWSIGSKICMTFTFLVMLWTLLYLKEHIQFIVSYSASSYYFNSTKSYEGSADVMVGCKASFKHCGSIALAGLLHTVITILRVIVESFARQSGRNGRNVVGAIIACLTNCLVR